MNLTNTNKWSDEVVELVLEDVENVCGGYPVSPPPGGNNTGGGG